MKLWINFGKYYFNRKTGEVIYSEPKENPDINFSLPNWKIVTSSDGLEYFFNSKINVNTWRIPERLKFKLEEYYPYKGPSYGTKNRGNTCFIDSVIVAIFSSIDPFTNYLLYSPVNSISQYKTNPCKGIGPVASIKSINQIRDELKNLRGMLVDGYRRHERENIHKLLKNLQKCGGNVDKFCSGEIGEVSSFVEWLLKLLPISETSIQRNISFVSRKGRKWKMLKDQWLFDSLPVIIVGPYKILRAESGTYLREILNESDNSFFKPPIILESMNDGVKYSKQIDIKRIKYCPVLFVTLYRNIMGGQYITKKIIPDETLTLDSGQKLLLTSVIVYGELHFWCYFYAPGSGWFYYNDLEEDGKPHEIGSYKDLINKSDITKKGTIYKYSVVETDYWGQDMPWLQNVQKESSESLLSSSSDSSK